jgi:hypothetical protein
VVEQHQAVFIQDYRGTEASASVTLTTIKSPFKYQRQSCESLVIGCPVSGLWLEAAQVVEQHQAVFIQDYRMEFRVFPVELEHLLVAP